MLQTGAGGGTNWGALAGGGAMAAGGAVGWYQSLQSGSKVGATLSGATTGAGIGTMIMPGIGTAIGAAGAVAGFASFIGGKGREAGQRPARRLHRRGRRARALGEQARPSGMTLDALLKAKTVKDYEAAIGSLNGKLAATAAMQGQLAGLQEQLADRQVMDLQAAEEITAKYGGTLGNLGQQFEAAKAQASFKTVFDDYERLIDMGGDVGGSLFIMKEEIGALVGESKRIGTEIPEQFKPLIEELIRTGQLFDENGEKIDDISTLKFGAPLKSEADTIKDAILELVKALKEQLLPTIERIPRTINVHTGYTYDPYEPPDGGSGGGSENGRGGGDYSSYPGYATGALITREHVARVGEGGVPELIGPVGLHDRSARRGHRGDRGRSRGEPDRRREPPPCHRAWRPRTGRTRSPRAPGRARPVRDQGAVAAWPSLSPSPARHAPSTRGRSRWSRWPTALTGFPARSRRLTGL